MTKQIQKKATKPKQVKKESDSPSVTVWTYVDSISKKKNYIPITEETNKAYDPYTINKALSMFPDTLAYAGEMNRYYFLPKNLQYDYLINSIRSQSRYAKWVKKEKESEFWQNINAIREYYGYNESKAKSALSILTDEQLATIKQKLEKGGVAK